MQEMKLLTIAPILTLFLMGCSTPPTGNGGFSVPAYSREQRKEVHSELIDGCCPMTVEFLKDYKVLRDQVRVN